MKPNSGKNLSLRNSNCGERCGVGLTRTNEPSIGFAKFIILNKILRSTMFYM
ncbi:hypothetical protein JG687_00008460 [Phytophthora cactorum]|uniref:Uncharacterized protein n=1 Tax=Phytophthora cactorum TaxID=29920 RepID=A0A8T1UCP2_9STRA|nr:hypothetical protein JG687_00008460 [Phytophthora cactorum]